MYKILILTSILLVVKLVTVIVTEDNLTMILHIMFNSCFETSELLKVSNLGESQIGLAQ